MNKETPMTTQRKTASSRRDAIALLKEDHRLVQKLFKDFDKLKDQDDSGDEKAELVETICNELKIHAQVEEEIFYPAVRAAIDDDDLMDEAKVEHDGAKQTIAELEAMRPGDELYDAKVTVLGEYVNHHVGEEQDSMFPKAKRAKINLQALGAELAERKREIKAEMGISEEESAPPPSERGPLGLSKRGNRASG